MAGLNPSLFNSFFKKEKKMKRVCIFCGSSNGFQPSYQEIAKAMGEELVRREMGLIYGGGNIGLMSIIAEVVLAGKGEVLGVIPEFMKEKDLARQDLTELHVVETMHERKALMADLADGFIALPGGYGTLEEFCEMITWRQLHIHKKPCGLLNFKGFFNAFISFVDHQVEEGFVSRENRSLLLASEKPTDLLDLLEKA